jgi:hypothetical protein
VPDDECPRCQCDPNLSNGVADAGAYYLFSEFSGRAACRGFLGGQLIFEGRGFNSILVLPLMIAVAALGAVMALLAVS